MIKLSIIILSWNTKELLKQCLRSVISDQLSVASKEKLVTNHYPLTTEAIVVDNGSTDGSPQMLKKEFPKVRLIENKENLGFAKGNNVGIKTAKGEYVMLLNSDTIVEEGAIEKLTDFLDKNETAAGVMPLLLNENGTIQKDPIFLRFPSPLLVIFYYNSILKNIAVKYFPKFLYSITSFDRIAEIDQLSGAAMMVRKNILISVNGLDERYIHYFEDVDLSFCLKRKGFKLFLNPEAKIVHLGGQSTNKIIEQEGQDKKYYLNYSSLFLFSEKNYSLIKSFMIKFVVLFQLLIRGKMKLICKLIK